MTDAVIQTRRIAANGLEFDIDECGEGDNVALLLHGFPESRVSWRRQLPFLASLGWRAVAPDMRGYGNSSRPKGREAYHLRHLVEDMEGLFRALGAKQRLLIGHDWGGVIAWAAAATDACRLDGLVVINAPHPVIYRRVLARHPAQLLKSWYVAFFQLPGVPEAALRRNKAGAIAQAFSRAGRAGDSVPPEFVETFRENFLAPGAATAMINYYRANASMLFDKRYETVIQCPVLLIWGEDDFALDLSLTEDNDRVAADFKLTRLPGRSHWVNQEAPDEVNAAMSDWMSEKSIAANHSHSIASGLTGA